MRRQSRTLKVVCFFGLVSCGFFNIEKPLKMEKIFFKVFSWIDPPVCRREYILTTCTVEHIGKLMNCIPVSLENDQWSLEQLTVGPLLADYSFHYLQPLFLKDWWVSHN